MKVGARLDKLEEIKKLFPKDFSVVGVGVTAFPRSGLAYLLPNYKILSLFETSDLKSIREKCEVVSVEKDLKGDFPEKFNTSGIIQIDQASKWLKENAKGLFLYKASTVTDRILHSQDKSCKRLSTNAIQHSDIGRGDKTLDFKLLSTPGHIRKVFENKKEFRVDAQKAGLNIPKGETFWIDDLDEKKWEEFKEDLGERLVFQLTDYTIGGGLGTFFIDSAEDLKEFRDFVERRRLIRAEEGRVIEWVNVTERIMGRSGSIAGCATHYGAVASILQNQIMDQPELAALAGRSGVWLGQDWHVRFSEKAQLAAEEQVKKWGEYIYKKGYKGIFGLDLMVTDKDEVKVIECNSRYTGAFPVLTMAQLLNKEMPIDVWHLLEWLGVEYEMDIDEVRKVYRQPKRGAFVILHNLERRFVTPTKTVKAGVYRFASPRQVNFSSDFVARKTAADTEKNLKQKAVKVEWVRPGFSLLDIKNDNELVLCDRVPTEEMVLKPAERLGRLVFGRKIVTDEGKLLDWTKEVVRAIYEQFELAVVDGKEVS